MARPQPDPDSIEPFTDERSQVRAQGIGGGRVDWLRIVFAGNPSENSPARHFTVYGRFGRTIDGVLEVVLHEVPEDHCPDDNAPEVGALYLVRSNLLGFGYNRSWNEARRQDNMGLIP